MLSNLIYFWIDSMAPQMADIRRKQIVSRDNYLSQKTIICLKRQFLVAAAGHPVWRWIVAHTVRILPDARHFLRSVFRSVFST